MQPVLILVIVACYFILLLIISYFTGKNADNASFFLGNKKSPWYIVAFGMIGASLSGVTFISVPGWVGSSQFSYMQVVLGYLFGYFVIANILMPAYYRLNLTSIYTYLEKRFGFWSHKTGVLFFLFSRTFGASARLFLVATVLQITVLDKLNFPFTATVIITILLIWLYTFKGGIRTIIWTDTLQTTFMLLAVGLSMYLIAKNLNFNFSTLVNSISESNYSRIFFFDDWNAKNHFIKQFLGGAFIAIAMTGLDQDMMQKNLSCKNINDAKKNMYWFSIILVPVNLLFLSLGAILFIYASNNDIIVLNNIERFIDFAIQNNLSLNADPEIQKSIVYAFANEQSIHIIEHSDNLFPIIASGGALGSTVGIFFIIGIIAAAYSSADSALTALTTSFTVDILNTKNLKEDQLRKRRKMVHIGFSVLLIVVILIFNKINDRNVIDTVFTVAGYTYGPLLGLFAFGFFTKKELKDSFLILLIAILSPVLCYFISINSELLFNGYKFGYELLILNGLVTYLGLFLISKKPKSHLGK